MYANGEGIEQNYEVAAKWLTLAAELGHARAQNSLGVCYAKGKGVEQNDKTAVKWYTLAAEQGHAEAQNNLGFRYNNGKGVEQSKSKKIHMKNPYTTEPFYNKSEVDFDSWDAIDQKNLVKVNTNRQYETADYTPKSSVCRGCGAESPVVPCKHCGYLFLY